MPNSNRLVEHDLSENIQTHVNENNHVNVLEIENTSGNVFTQEGDIDILNF